MNRLQTDGTLLTRKGFSLGRKHDCTGEEFTGECSAAEQGCEDEMTKTRRKEIKWQCPILE
jgi:hypothetical protein